MRYIKEFRSTALSEVKYSTKSQFLVQRGRQGFDVLAHGLCRLARDRRARGAQYFHSPGQTLPGPWQRIIMGEQPGARQQHVAGQLRIVQLQRLHGLVQAGPQHQVWAPALKQQVGEEQQEADDD